MAYTLALVVNFGGLIFSIWLGVYIVTHGRSSWVAWLSGFTLWALAGLFANILLTMFASPAPASQPFWLRLIFPFWPQTIGESNLAAWNQGWAGCLGAMLWYHTTVLILDYKPTGWLRWSIFIGYGLGILAFLLQLYTPWMFKTVRSDPVLIDTLQLGSLYPFFALVLITYSGLSLRNLLLAKSSSASIIVKKQLNTLAVASGFTSVAVLGSIAGSIPGTSIPTFWTSILLLCAACIFGYGVVRYSALLGNRILRRDIAYSAVATSAVVLLYLAMYLWLRVTYNVPEGVVVFLIPLVILSHSLAEELRRVLEHFTYDYKTRSQRASLRDLSRLAVEQTDIGEYLSRSLETICSPVRATYGVVLIFEDEAATVSGSYRWKDGQQSLPRRDFLADDTLDLNPGSLPEPFSETTLLLPLYSGEVQIGALLLGRPENGLHYSREDLQLVQGPSERIAGLILRTRRLAAYLDQLAKIPLEGEEQTNDLIPVQWVEEALQNLYDYAYLGESPLANLKQVKTLLPDKGVTHLDKGKAVYQVLTLAMEKLRPMSDLPSGPIPRKWFPYIILHDAYFDGLPNRDIISRLYVSEGTFNRTRRSALRSIARVLSELQSI